MLTTLECTAPVGLLQSVYFLQRSLSVQQTLAAGCGLTESSWIMVHDSSTPAPTPHCSIADWQSFSFAGVVSPQSGYIHWCWPNDADTSHQNSVTLLCSTSSSSSLCASKCIPVAGSGSCYFTPGLWQRHHDRPPAYLMRRLAAHFRAHQVQGRCSHL